MTNSKGQNCVDSKPRTIPPFMVDTQKALRLEKEAFAFLSKALQCYKPSEVMVAFNGGKDCTVLLHMIVKFYKQNCLEHMHVPVLYIKTQDSFDEIEEIVQHCAQIYDVEMITRCGNVKDALRVVCTEMPHMRAVFLGSRSTDPYCGNLQLMQVTDSDWPPLMRINPILFWNCRDVWNYIFANNVPYCKLYEQGYTSLGSKSNTRPNPYLKHVDPLTREISYGHAYELADDDDLERAGRS